MFDTKKIHQIISLLIRIPSEFDNVYIVPEAFPKEAAALFKRLKLPVRAVMDDTQAGKVYAGLSIISTAEAAEKFNERTILIVLTQKPVPFIQTTFDIKKQGGTWTVPALVIDSIEVIVIYESFMTKELRQLYIEDGFSELNKSVNKLAERFSRGLTAMLQPNIQNFKYKFWGRSINPKMTYDFDDTAIVFQGPIEYANNYTAETFKFYRATYPNVPIVVSTWKGEATNDFRRECRENSVVLLENEPPELRGPANINLQLKSSLQGVRYVQENTSAKFVLKTRTDQSMSYARFLVYFKNLLETFPPKGDKLRGRIIFLGSDIHRKWPFSPQDFLSFGHVEDISKLYDIPFHGKQGKMTYWSKHEKRRTQINDLMNKVVFDYNTVTEQNHNLFKLNRMMDRFYWPEMYIARSFYEKHIAPVDPTKLFETSWKFAVDYSILVDYNTIQLDWPKYEKDRYSLDNYFGNGGAFARWLDMYRNFKIDWV